MKSDYNGMNPLNRCVPNGMHGGVEDSCSTNGWSPTRTRFLHFAYQFC
jgi:hypothetical protein